MIRNNKIRLTESDLNRIVRNSVNKVIKEGVLSQQQSTLQPNSVNPDNYMPGNTNIRIGRLMGELRQLWQTDQDYALEIVNNAFGTNFTM